MPLMPKRVKYRKTQRGSRKGTASRNLKIDFGEFGLQTLERAWITNTQLEAARVALTRNMKRKGKLWIRIFPDKSVTSRPPETRMGKGKGQPEYWVATVRPGNILFEIDGVPESIARDSLRLAADKLPVRTKFLSRHRVSAAYRAREPGFTQDTNWRSDFQQHEQDDCRADGHACAAPQVWQNRQTNEKILCSR